MQLLLLNTTLYVNHEVSNLKQSENKNLPSNKQLAAWQIIIKHRVRLMLTATQLTIPMEF